MSGSVEETQFGNFVEKGDPNRSGKSVQRETQRPVTLPVVRAHASFAFSRKNSVTRINWLRPYKYVTTLCFFSFPFYYKTSWFPFSASITGNWSSNRTSSSHWFHRNWDTITQQGSQFNSIERNIYSASRQCSNIYIIINFPLVFVYLVSHLDITI